MIKVSILVASMSKFNFPKDKGIFLKEVKEGAMASGAALWGREKGEMERKA